MIIIENYRKKHFNDSQLTQCKRIAEKTVSLTRCNIRNKTMIIVYDLSLILNVDLINFEELSTNIYLKIPLQIQERL